MHNSLSILIFIVAFVSRIYSLTYLHSEDPKSYVTRIRLNYNYTYEITEIETKLAKTLNFYSYANWNFGIMGAITIFIHPSESFWGAYPVDNLIGYIGIYAEATNFLIPQLNLTLYPLSHESTHLVDGYDRGDINTDKIFDSNEYLGFDISYSFYNFQLTAGILLYIYFNKPIETVPRPFIARIHTAENYTIKINSSLEFQISSDLALFYEGYFHPAVNLGVGVRIAPTSIMMHYEYQVGLGQDYKDVQQRLGVEFIIY